MYILAIKLKEIELKQKENAVKTSSSVTLWTIIDTVLSATVKRTKGTGTYLKKKKGKNRNLAAVSKSELEAW